MRCRFAGIEKACRVNAAILRLRELHLRILAVGRQSNGHWGTEQPSSVDDTEKGYLLLPDFDHCIIESSDIFLSLFNGLLLGDLLSHDAKIAGNNLAWKDIDFMPDVEGESKKNERYVENVVRNQ